jgi:hypothetical protein
MTEIIGMRQAVSAATKMTEAPGIVVTAVEAEAEAAAQ